MNTFFQIKGSHLELYGIREVIVAPFDVMRQMDWQDFVAQYLQEELGVVHLGILPSPTKVRM